MTKPNLFKCSYLPEMLDELTRYYNCVVQECDGECLKCFAGDKTIIEKDAKNEDVDCVFDSIRIVKRAYEKAINFDKGDF